MVALEGRHKICPYKMIKEKMHEKAIIQTQNLCKVYGIGDLQVNALDGVDLLINEGEFVAVLGP